MFVELKEILLGSTRIIRQSDGLSVNLQLIVSFVRIYSTDTYF